MAFKIPSPQEIGLPEKFEKWRPSQEEALSVIITDKHRVKGLCKPTGSGKSAVNVAAALLSKKSTCIVTWDKGLQNQYMQDFAEIGMVDIRGRSNYPCSLRDEYTCEDGYAARCPYKGSVACPASQAEMRAALSPLVVTNYSKWTSAKRYGQGMDHFTQVIFDEGHKAPEALAQAMQVPLNHREIEESLGIDFPSFPDAERMEVWKAWAVVAKRDAEDEQNKAWERIKGVKDPKPSWVRHYSHMKNLVRRLSTISTAGANNWVVDEVERGFVFDPIRPARYGEAMLLMRMEHILFTSASLRIKTLGLSGVAKDQYYFQEFASDFNPEDCPIYYVPVMRVDGKSTPFERLNLWLKHDQIAARRRDRKGAVNTVSFARRDEIMAASRFADSMIFNEKGEPTTKTIELFKESAPGTILVSPSISMGYDFPGDQLEWSFLVKIPFEPPSKIVQAREKDDREYRGYKAIQSMEQFFGRGNRFFGDRCEGFIGDMHLKWFLPQFGHLATKNFHNRFKRVEVLPAPLQKM